jgi:hypothetical protein
MKKHLLTLLSWSTFAIAQTGPQPLHFSSITFLPQGCGTGATFNLKATASGGTPAADGTYTYQLEGQPSQVAQVAQFNDMIANSNELTLTVTDENNKPVAYTVRANQSQSGAVSMTIDSLPLGEGPGCITLSITDPSFTTLDTQVDFAITELGETPVIQTMSKEPFKITFSAFSSQQLLAIVGARSDCGPIGSSEFNIQFPFPQGQGNALKIYLFNKYCSCALLDTTVPVV